MAKGIIASYAYSELRAYKDWIEKVEDFAKKNYQDMDFENSKEWEKMGEIIQKMVTDCEDAMDDMDKIYFQE